MFRFFRSFQEKSLSPPKIDVVDTTFELQSHIRNKPLIIDHVRFLNEFELLEMRFEILWDLVSYFIITESELTHSGKKKPLNFFENRHNFRKYESKIIYNPLKSIPETFLHLIGKQDNRLDFGDVDPNSRLPYFRNPIPYQREAYERDLQILGLETLFANLSEDTVILISDLDEIPNPKILKNTSWIERDKAYVCQQRAYLYKFNLLYHSEWLGTNIFRVSYLKKSKKGFHQIHAEAKSSARVLEGGWHFSWLGDEERFKEKLSAQPESDFFDTPERQIKSKEIIERRLDPFGRDLKLQLVPLDETFPSFLLANIERYRQFIA